jgi:hypothetical protein
MKHEQSRALGLRSRRAAGARLDGPKRRDQLGIEKLIAP